MHHFTDQDDFREYATPRDVVSFLEQHGHDARSFGHAGTQYSVHENGQGPEITLSGTDDVLSWLGY